MSVQRMSSTDMYLERTRKSQEVSLFPSWKPFCIVSTMVVLHPFWMMVLHPFWMKRLLGKKKQ